MGRIRINVYNPKTKSEHVEYVNSVSECGLIDRWLQLGLIVTMTHTGDVECQLCHESKPKIEMRTTGSNAICRACW